MRNGSHYVRLPGERRWHIQLRGHVTWCDTYIPAAGVEHLDNPSENARLCWNCVSAELRHADGGPEPEITVEAKGER